MLPIECPLGKLSFVSVTAASRHSTGGRGRSNDFFRTWLSSPPERAMTAQAIASRRSPRLICQTTPASASTNIAGIPPLCVMPIMIVRCRASLPVSSAKCRARSRSKSTTAPLPRAHDAQKQKKLVRTRLTARRIQDERGKDMIRTRENRLRGHFDLADAHRGVRLAMALHAAIVLAALEMLDVHLDRRMIDDFADHAGAGDDGLANRSVVVALGQEHAVELNVRTDLRLAEIDVHDIAFLHAILPRTILEHSVHILTPPGVTT